ncbi:Methyltransferase type 11 [Thalassoporum mexicanum PCC 7367]|nr:methyltransferase domain-containing protein [Pseudanabaena sp. PCC 7367]AFY69367.1 Methyltransferase type 11 [Pseudanabaena sp. PCC 7367]
MHKNTDTRIINSNKSIKLAIAAGCLSIILGMITIGLFVSLAAPAMAEWAYPAAVDITWSKNESRGDRLAFSVPKLNLVIGANPKPTQAEATIAQLPVYDPEVASQIEPKQDFYTKHALHSPDGIGKFYLGREIAKVMGHTEAVWLERPSRQWQEDPDAVIAALHLKPTDVVADIGAGTGYFSFRLSQQLTQGKVYAVDIQPEMIDILRFLKTENAIDNVETVLSDPQDPHLPSQSIDLALMVDAYHEFAYPHEMMQGIVKALKSGGRVVLVEYRRENPFIAIKTLHKMTQRQAKQEMAAVGLSWLETDESLPSQHIMIFQKPMQELEQETSSTEVK